MKTLAFLAGAFVGAGVVLSKKVRVTVVHHQPLPSSVSPVEFDALWDAGVSLANWDDFDEWLDGGSDE